MHCKSSNQVKIFLLFLILIVFAGFNEASASQTWDIKARERSQILVSRAQSQLKEGNLDAGIATLVEATQADSSDPLPFRMLGLAYARKGKFKEAIEELEKSGELDPDSSETALSIGLVYYLKHDYQSAIKWYRKVRKLNPKLCQVYANAGLSFIRTGKFDKADNSFRRVIDCYPNSHVAYEGLAEAYYLTGKLAEARKAALHAESIGTYPPARFLLAKMDFLTGDYTRARRALKQYIKVTRKPWTQRAMTEIGYPLQHDFRWDPYREDDFDNGYLLEARNLDLPKQEKKLQSLARKGKADWIIEKINSRLEGSENDYYLIRQLGLAELSRGHYSNASEYFRKSLNLCPQCIIDELHLARALSLDGKAPQASAAVRRFQKQAPDQNLASIYTEMAKVDTGLAKDQALPAHKLVDEKQAVQKPAKHGRTKEKEMRVSDDKSGSRTEKKEFRAGEAVKMDDSPF